MAVDYGHFSMSDTIRPRSYLALLLPDNRRPVKVGSPVGGFFVTMMETVNIEVSDVTEWAEVERQAMDRFWKHYGRTEWLDFRVVSLQCVDITEAARWFFWIGGRGMGLVYGFSKCHTTLPLWLVFRSKGFVIDGTG